MYIEIKPYDFCQEERLIKKVKLDSLLADKKHDFQNFVTCFNEKFNIEKRKTAFYTSEVSMGTNSEVVETWPNSAVAVIPRTSLQSLARRRTNWEWYTMTISNLGITTIYTSSGTQTDDLQD